MLVVMLIDMSLIPLQITITSRMKDPISMQHERLRTVRTSEFNYFYICEFVSATETVGKFCSSLVGTDSLKLFVHQEIKLCPSGCNTSSRYVLVLRIRRWRSHLHLRIPGSILCTLCFEMRTILSLGERKGTHFNLLFSNAKNG